MEWLIDAKDCSEVLTAGRKQEGVDRLPGIQAFAPAGGLILSGSMALKIAVHGTGQPPSDLSLATPEIVLADLTSST
jgi:hypothetical protein